MTRRFWVIIVPGLLVLGALLAGVLLLPRWLSSPTTEGASGASSSGGSVEADGSSPSSTGASSATATVSRRDLIDRVAVDGTLAYGDERSIGAGKPGMVTAVPDEGALVERGQSLFTIDDRKLPLLYGTAPLWRTLSVGVSDGADVKQLEENLQALGFADGLYFTVDEHFDLATQIAVQRWQKANGTAQTGTAEKGDLVFQPGPARVKERKAKVGQEVQPGGAVVSVTGADRVVTVKLDPDRQSLANEGDAVQIELPGGKTIGGKVTKVGTVATTSSSDGSGDGDNGSGGGSGNGGGGGNGSGSGSGSAKISVTVSLDDPSAVGRLDEAPVSVKLTKATAKNALSVPVNALLALREGGYAVEVDRGGKHALVGVTLGAFADGHVAITGDVHEGDKVVISK